MDKLSYTTQQEFVVAEYCSKKLIELVVKDFERNNLAIKTDNEEKNFAVDISDYVKDSTIAIDVKLTVLLTFLKCGSKIVYKDKTYRAIIDLLKSRGNIDETQLLDDLRTDKIITAEQFVSIYEPRMKIRAIPQFSINNNWGFCY